MIKIYFDNKPLYIVNDRSQVDELLHRETTIFVDELDVHTVKTMIQEMELDNYETGVMLHTNVQEALEAFEKRFEIIRAGGGLVYTDDEEVLLIFRRGKWDLPKGKLDEGEDIQTCALREVKEETGLERLSLLAPIFTTYHTYHEKEKHILKETDWFLMKSAWQELKPQTEEDILECRWVKTGELPGYLDTSYGLIRDVMEKGLAMMKED
ncbi:MAG: NUDIX hydrolase [Flavisolibacter sp.]